MIIDGVTVTETTLSSSTSWAWTQSNTQLVCEIEWVQARETFVWRTYAHGLGHSPGVKMPQQRWADCHSVDEARGRVESFLSDHRWLNGPAITRDTGT